VKRFPAIVTIVPPDRLRRTDDTNQTPFTPTLRSSVWRQECLFPVTRLARWRDCSRPFGGEFECISLLTQAVSFRRRRCSSSFPENGEEMVISAWHWRPPPRASPRCERIDDDCSLSGLPCTASQALAGLRALCRLRAFFSRCHSEFRSPGPEKIPSRTEDGLSFSPYQSLIDSGQRCGI
jgi:hypothetical protein